MEKISLKANDGLVLSCLYSKALKPIGIVQIVHGMIEHKERYEDFINFLSQNGYTVIISDLRGHGESINDEYKLGHIGTIEQMVDDQMVVTEYVKKKNPHLPLYMFAHSMGSLIGRMYIEHHDDELKKLILSGTVGRPFGVELAVMIANMNSKGKKQYKASKTLWKFSNGMSKDPSLDWLSYNKENIERYSKDPLCNITFDNHSYQTLFKMVHYTAKRKRYECKNPLLEIRSVSGLDDRTTLGTKGVKRTLKYLMMAGYQKLSFIEYPNMKHEILQEDNKEEVYNDVIKFYGEK